MKYYAIQIRNYSDVSIIGATDENGFKELLKTAAREIVCAEDCIIDENKTIEAFNSIFPIQFEMNSKMIIDGEKIDHIITITKSAYYIQNK